MILTPTNRGRARTAVLAALDRRGPEWVSTVDLGVQLRQEGMAVAPLTVLQLVRALAARSLVELRNERGRAYVRRKEGECGPTS